MKRNVWLLGVVSLLLLSGCNPDSGLALIEVSYPSGYVRTSTTWDELTPVEEAEYQLRAQKAEDYDKTYHYDLQILDGAGDQLYEIPDVGQATMRGELAGDKSSVWVCSEWWGTVHYNGYLNGRLSKSIILLVDMADGAVLFQGETGEGELYLTSVKTRCYFYDAGEPGQTAWFGLVRTPGPSVIIGLQKSQSYQRFSGRQQEVLSYINQYTGCLSQCL